MENYKQTFSIKRLWIILTVGMVFMFGILLFLGAEIYQKAPPMPQVVKSASGEVLYTLDDIETGQNVWQSIGGMEQGSIWGHGSYLAPDWSADWLHREAETLLALLTQKPMTGLSKKQALAVQKAALQEEMRTNSYDPATGIITVSDLRAQAIKQVETHFVRLYEGSDPQSLALRRDYAFPVHGLLNNEEAKQLGILRTSTATVMVLFATIIFLFGGVLGTFHHLYFSGTPTSVIAVGAMVSALEVVPLLVVGFEAYTRHKVEHEAEWESNYRWPFMFFAAVLFWNLVGAGLFGFLINPPIALYYMQGLNTTANHGHAALFGVYGMLGLGLTLYCMRGLTNVAFWNEKLLKISFWSLNIGLAMMTFLSLLPQGILQTYTSIEKGYPFARSAEFIHGPIMQALAWARVPGDVVFSVGVFAFVWFVFRAIVPQKGKIGGTATEAII